MTEPEQWAVELWEAVELALDGMDPELAALTIQRAFEERERKLRADCMTQAELPSAKPSRRPPMQDSTTHEALEALNKKATPGTWEIDSEYDGDGAYGCGPDHDSGYRNYFIGADVGGQWKTLPDTVNSDHKLIEEDYDENGKEAWDVIGRANANFIVALVNAYRTGQLIHVVPSGDGPEAAARIQALETSLAEAEGRVKWVFPKSIADMPVKPGKAAYEYVECLILRKGEMLARPWNCEHQVFDDEAQDDFFCEWSEVTAYMELTAIRALASDPLLDRQGE